MAGFELTLYGRIWVTPEDQLLTSPQSLSNFLRGAKRLHRHGFELSVSILVTDIVTASIRIHLQ
jgi:hypothetical protein